MCGIAGKVYFKKGTTSEPELRQMSASIIHRGPDDEGILISQDRKVGLVNRRLAIIDLSVKGHQPMNYKGRWITFNGEIYNFQEERNKLIKEGYQFSSKTDTEVILALYDKYGTKCLKFLRGMFAFAIYDKAASTLFLARDRLGKKPLKYYLNKEVFIFASELKAILTQKEVKRQPDFLAIYNYLTYGYVPAPSTGFIGIQKLEPGHFLSVDLKTGRIRKEKYWQPDYSDKLNLSIEAWSERILNLLEESTRLRMISDVPIGAFLSGGVDSSCVVAMMSRFSTKPIKTFTIRFKDQKWNEAPHARRIAKMYKTDHRELTAEPASAEILPFLVKQFEEPFSDASSVVTYMVSKLAREEVTVILNGDGGDENFGGYDRYCRLKRDAILENYKWFLTKVGLPVTSIIRTPYFSQMNRFLNKLKGSLADRYVSYNSYFLKADKERLLSSKFYEIVGEYDSYKIINDVFSASGVKGADSALYFDITNYLASDLLVKVDIASMAVSLEGRSPFLDHKLVELACQIPFDLKVRGKCNLKYILKKAAEKVVPQENLYRGKKGFSIPLKDWFSGSLKKYSEGILLSKKALSRDFFEEGEVSGMFEKHGDNADFGPKLWSLLSLELWFRAYFD